MDTNQKSDLCLESDQFITHGVAPVEEVLSKCCELRLAETWKSGREGGGGGGRHLECFLVLDCDYTGWLLQGCSCIELIGLCRDVVVGEETLHLMAEGG